MNQPQIELATRDAIAPYATLIEPAEDGSPFGAKDAQLDLSNGIPRLYLMKLVGRAPLIKYIARHNKVTQCLASSTGKDWFIGLAPAGPAPTRDQIRVFRIPGGTALALKKGTWHAGPYFSGSSADFFNLELVDTNDNDKDEAPVEPPIAIPVDGPISKASL
jgi:ureidoglycolate hydrolase